MDTPRQPRFLIVESDSKYAQWLQHSLGAAGWPAEAVVVMDWTAFGRVHAAMTARDYEIVLLALSFDEGIEDPTTDGFDWIRRLRAQTGFPEMIILAEGGSELAAVRTLRLGAADYLPKRLLNPSRLQRSLKLTLRAIEKDALRRAERAAQQAAKVSGASTPAAPDPAAAAAEVSSARVSPLSTHTGAVLAKAAAQVIPPPKPAVTNAAPQPVLPPVTPAAAAPEKPETPKVAAIKREAAPAQDVHEKSLPAVSASHSQPLREARPVAPESHHIPGYTILQRIGESEAAAVYLAISEDIGRNVALKISKRRYAGNSDDTGQRAIMFQREFEAIAALDHPSIIDLYDYGIHEGVEYLAMEYFPCGDLKARLQNPLTADEAIAFVREIARSLKIVHDAGIIHRDLKPPNVMLRDDGSVVLIDFGLARSLLTGDSSTRTGVLRGSPYYMSPEQAQGENLDARTDLYSLGVILYEMLAGRKPYLGTSAIDVLQQHVMAPVPELPVHHLAYQPLLERLMSKSREHRIASCDELLTALDRMTQSMNDAELVDPAALVSAGVGH